MLTLLRSRALWADKLNWTLLRCFCLLLLRAFRLKHRLINLQIVLRRATSENDLEVELIGQILHKCIVSGVLDGLRGERDTYLQPFYFALETEDVVFHIATVEALLALLLWRRGSLRRIACNFFSILDDRWLPLLR